MTLAHRILRPSFVVPAVSALLASTAAEAQMPLVLRPLIPATHVTFDGYYAHYRLDSRGGDRLGMDGMGARIMWRTAMVDDDVAVVPSRLAFGLFGEYAPEQSTGFSVAHLGVQGDVNLLSPAWRGRFIPVLSLGAGVLSTRKELTRSTASGPNALLRRSTNGNPPASGNSTSFALSPAVGARVAVWRQLGMRADVRDVLTFRDGTHHNIQLAAGLSYPF